MYIAIFTGGKIQNGNAVKDIIQNTDIFLAADSGAASALKFGIKLKKVIGDFDSLNKQTTNKLQKNNVELVKFPQDKNETDTQLAIDIAIKSGATKIAIIGGITGNRLDHIIANVLLLTQYKIPICFVNGNQKTWQILGPKEEVISGKTNDLLSLIPLNGNAMGVTTENLQYSLNNETLFFGKPKGLSNVFIGNIAKVRVEKGNLLFTHIVL